MTKALKAFRTFKDFFDNWGLLSSVVGFTIIAAVYITKDTIYKWDQTRFREETERKLEIIAINQTTMVNSQNQITIKVDSFSNNLQKGIIKINGIDQFLQTKYSNDINYWRLKSITNSIENEKKKQLDTILLTPCHHYQFPEFSYLNTR